LEVKIHLRARAGVAAVSKAVEEMETEVAARVMAAVARARAAEMEVAARAAADEAVRKAAMEAMAEGHPMHRA
jgi:hypothetical protein